MNCTTDYDQCKWQTHPLVRKGALLGQNCSCLIVTQICSWALTPWMTDLLIVSYNVTLTLRKECDLDDIPNECLRHFPRSPVHLTYVFNHCFWLSHLLAPWKEVKMITLPKPGKDPKFLPNLHLISLFRAGIICRNSWVSKIYIVNWMETFQDEQETIMGKHVGEPWEMFWIVYKPARGYCGMSNYIY